ncbi:MAG: hypothetical protein EOO35_00065 [Cyanobacteriota bacterium]|nr:MAG: hypothetical protein EOO35_00065 [Cyanobacteriota bacterium]
MEGNSMVTFCCALHFVNKMHLLQSSVGRMVPSEDCGKATMNSRSIGAFCYTKCIHGLMPKCILVKQLEHFADDGGEAAMADRAHALFRRMCLQHHKFYFIKSKENFSSKAAILKNLESSLYFLNFIG